MIIETMQSSQPVLTINGVPHLINIKEYESFIQQCELFMSTENDSLEIMTQIICDQILDSASPATTVEEIRPQIKFLKELGFLLKNFVTPLTDSEEG